MMVVMVKVEARKMVVVVRAEARTEVVRVEARLVVVMVKVEARMVVVVVRAEARTMRVEARMVVEATAVHLMTAKSLEEKPARQARASTANTISDLAPEGFSRADFASRAGEDRGYR